MIYIIVLLSAVTVWTYAPGEGPSLKDTYEGYIRAIEDRDLEALFQTVTETETVHFIGTTGRMTTTWQEYHHSHAEWFAETGWDIAFELKELHEEANLGYAMAVFTYHDATPEKQRLTLVSWVTLIFHREKGVWRMIADVCTPISREVE